MMPVAQSMPPHGLAAEHGYLFLGAGPTADLRQSLNAPWRYAAFAQIRTLEEEGRNYPGLGDLRVTETTSSHARQILAQMNIAEVPTPTVVPISGGGLAISWNVGRREVQLSVFSDGDIVYMRTEGEAVVGEIEEGALSQARYVAGLEWLLGRES